MGEFRVSERGELERERETFTLGFVETENERQLLGFLLFTNLIRGERG